MPTKKNITQNNFSGNRPLSASAATFFYYDDTQGGCFKKMLTKITSTKAGKKLDNINMKNPSQHDLSRFMEVHQESKQLIAKKTFNPKSVSLSSSPEPAFLLTESNSSHDTDFSFNFEVEQLPTNIEDSPKVTLRKKLTPKIDETTLAKTISKSVVPQTCPPLKCSNNEPSIRTRRKSFHITQEELLSYPRQSAFK